MSLQLRAMCSAATTGIPRACAISFALSCLLWAGCGSGVHSLGSTGVESLAVSAGPQLGYVWRASDATLRPILGVPGSAQIGAPVTAAGLYVAGTATLDGKVALLISTDGSVYRKTLPDGTASALGVNIGVDALIRFSPSGTHAVLYSPASGQAATLSDVMGNTAAQRLSLQQTALDITISDAGSIAMASGSGSVQINFIDSKGQAHRIASAGQFGGFRFLPGSDDILIGDASANTLTRVHTATTAPAPETLQTSALLHTPVAVAATANGQWALVANKDDGSVVRVGIATSGAQSFACDCSPTTIEPALGGNAFRVTDRTDLPLWIMDLSVAQPRLTFVPGLGSVTAASASQPDAQAVSR